MKRMVALLLLVLMVASITPIHAVNESYYLYPAIGYIGASTDLPAGEMVEWTVDCTIFFKGVKMQDMIPSLGNIINDDDEYTMQSFTLSEMCAVHITYTIRALIRFSIEYLWNGELCVDGQAIEKIDRDKHSWAQYKCFDVSGDWSMGFYASASGNVQTSNNEILMVFLLFFGLCFAIMIEKGCRWISKRRKRSDRTIKKSNRHY